MSRSLQISEGLDSHDHKTQADAAARIAAGPGGRSGGRWCFRNRRDRRIYTEHQRPAGAEPELERVRRESSSGQSLSSVSASWVQPTVKASSGNGTGYSAYWVGLGGASEQSQALEQVGTAADVTGGQTTYYAWYELVPSSEQKLNLTIHPGDHMSGKVTVSGTTVTVTLSDQTTGKSTTETLQMSNPDTSSAEWIAEAPASETSYGSFGR
jgi:hypothetical protein